MDTLLLGIICVGLFFAIIFLGLIHMKLCEIHSTMNKYINSYLAETNFNANAKKKAKVSNV